MPVRRSGSKGTPHAETWRSDELPNVDPAALTAPERDPQTGRFVRGNKASRRRKLIKQARSLPWLQEDRCEEWLRPFVRAAKDHAVDLLEDVGPDAGPLVAPIAEELAAARVTYRALLAQGLEGDPKALEAARGWLRESRQHALALEGLRRTEAANRTPANSTPWLVASNDPGNDTEDSK